MVVWISYDQYFWCGLDWICSFVEFWLMCVLCEKKLLVLWLIVVFYMCEGLCYWVVILMEWIEGVCLLVDCVLVVGWGVFWEEIGCLIVCFYCVGLDYVDFNVYNILFDGSGYGWLIDFDCGVICILVIVWCECNFKWLLCLLVKLCGECSVEDVQKDYVWLCCVYDMVWNWGI